MTIRFAVLTVSDRSFEGLREDASGPALIEEIKRQNWKVDDLKIVPDEIGLISKQLEHWADLDQIDVILTTGGTGFSPRDVTPEATKEIVDREAPGLSEVMRYESLKITPHAMLSRAFCGIRRKTIIINLPGSPRAAVENFGFLIPVLNHAVELLQEKPSSERGHAFNGTRGVESC